MWVNIPSVLSGCNPCDTHGGPAGATPRVPFCGDPLFLNHQATRSLVLPDERSGQSLPRSCRCRYRAGSRLYLAITTWAARLWPPKTKPLNGFPSGLPKLAGAEMSLFVMFPFFGISQSIPSSSISVIKRRYVLAWDVSGPTCLHQNNTSNMKMRYAT